MSNFAHLAQRLFNVPLAIRPEKAEIIMAALAARLGVVQLVRVNGDVLAFDGDYGAPSARGAQDEPHGYDLIEGVACIPISGTLVQKNGSLRPSSGMTGYDGIRQNLMVALGDDAVRAIVLDIDSPGGEVAGCFDLADAVFAGRKVKPIWAILSESAYSAAYALASAASRIIVPRTGGTGSIGVIYMHVDMSKLLAKEGLTVTLLQYGARKADGADVLPLAPEAKQRFQADIDRMGDLFVATVARNRRLAASAVKAQEAGTFLGAAGIAAGLADAVMAPDEAFAALLKSLDRTAA
jgi:capsid assembly protease